MQYLISVNEEEEPSIRSSWNILNPTSPDQRVDVSSVECVCFFFCLDIIIYIIPLSSDLFNRSRYNTNFPPLFLECVCVLLSFSTNKLSCLVPLSKLIFTSIVYNILLINQIIISKQQLRLISIHTLIKGIDRNNKTVWFYVRENINILFHQGKKRRIVAKNKVIRVYLCVVLQIYISTDRLNGIACYPYEPRRRIEQ